MASAETAAILVLPTRVGVDRTGCETRTASGCSPHTRGGGPELARAQQRRKRSPHTRGGGPCSARRRRPATTFSPHAWGWTVPSFGGLGLDVVLPTRVGVDPVDKSPILRGRSSPHTRGGGPFTRNMLFARALFSPHAWGWTVSRTLQYRKYHVLPTRVGVDRTSKENSAGAYRSPHTRGGGP